MHGWERSTVVTSSLPTAGQTESRGRLQGVAELRLAGLELTDASLRLLLRHAPQLSALDLSHCAHVGDPSVHLLTAPTSPLRETLVHLNLAGKRRPLSLHPSSLLGLWSGWTPCSPSGLSCRRPTPRLSPPHGPLPPAVPPLPAPPPSRPALLPPALPGSLCPAGSRRAPWPLPLPRREAASQGQLVGCPPPSPRTHQEPGPQAFISPLPGGQVTHLMTWDS